MSLWAMWDLRKLGFLSKKHRIQGQVVWGASRTKKGKTI